MKTKFLFSILLILSVIIIPVMATTQIIYPIMDGQQSRVVANQTYLQITSGAGTASSNTGTTGLIGAYTVASTATNNFSEARKCAFTFDLNTIPTTATIQSAYLRYVVTAKTVTLGTPDLVLVRFNPANNQAYATTDYTTYVLSPILADNVSSANLNAGYETRQNLNANGIQLINTSRTTTRYLSLGLITSWDATQTADYTLWGTARSAVYTIDLSDLADTVNDPYLSITYSDEPTTQTQSNANQEAFFNNMNLYFLFMIVVILICVGAFVPMVGILGAVVAISGLVSAFGQSFAMGFLFFIGLLISILEIALGEGLF
jgi:hypothetical protein